MNNKIMARIAAAMMSVTLVGTAVFAADPTVDMVNSALSFGTDAAVISANTPTDAKQVTMMSFLAADGVTAYVDEATTPMIALDQVAYGDVATLATINVLADKLNNADFNNVVVKIGSDGTANAELDSTWVITKEADKITITVMNGATTVATLEEDAEGYVTLPTTDVKFMVDGVEHKNAFKKAFTLYSWIAFDAEGNRSMEITLAEPETAVENVVYSTDAESGATVVKVKASVLEGKTLYPKFDTGIIVGDFNGRGGVESGDRALMNTYIVQKKTTVYQNIGGTYADLAKVSGIESDDTEVTETSKVGDFNGRGNATYNKIESGDRSLLNTYLAQSKTGIYNTIGAKFYYVNK